MSDEKQEIAEVLHEFGMSEDELDEVFIKDAHVHIERMDDTSFWIGIHATGMAPIMLNTGVCRGVWYFNVEEDSLDHKAQMLRIQRPRKSKPIPNPEIIELRTKLTAADARARSAEAERDAAIVERIYPLLNGEKS